MEFVFGETVYRDRRAKIVDPYGDGTTQTDGDWDPDLTITLERAFVASSSSTSLSSATRSELLTAKSLYLTDPMSDVQVGDRIRTGSMPFIGADAYFVNERPAGDTNPFTGWQPAVEIPLELTEG